MNIPKKLGLEMDISKLFYKEDKMLYFVMYLITRLDSLKTGLEVFASIGLIVGMILLCILVVARIADPEGDDFTEPTRNIIEKLTKPFLIVGFVLPFLKFSNPQPERSCRDLLGS